ncbi:hypothetical protein [Anaerobaca lacustris]|uniref:Uncharacterized protein n=1 Tax=Anaerobaca lacustris TaxID=3044600 RepID=A0AAW6TV70_9BACT|nr:hypothetical protein [Sedimentisphaerales bacterium M17dextr]
MELKNVREWAKGKPPELAFMSVGVALIPDLIYGVPTDTYTGSHTLPALRVPDIEQWKKLYVKPKEMLRGCFQFLGPPALEGFEHGQFLTSLFRVVSSYVVDGNRIALQELKRPSVPPDQFKRGLYAYLFSRLEVFAFEHAWARTIGDSAECQDSPNLPIEVVFCLRTWVFCWVVHKRSFWSLYQNARHGDIEALEKLVIVDRNILSERRIAKWWARICEDNESEEFERIHRALGKCPDLIRYEMPQAKIAAAGLIAKMSEAKNHPLSASEIGELFDALARDLAPEGQVVHKDPDVDRKSSQWRKAVARQKDKWSESPFFSSSQ